MAAPLYKTDSGFLYHGGQILVSAVGLPARGKTAVARSLERYMRWLGVTTKVFSLGEYRRKRLGHPSQLPPDYFSTGNRSPETEALRKQIRLEVEELIVEFYRSGGQVAIYDANNATIKERTELRDHFTPLGIHPFFIESVCTDPKVVESNVRAVKLSSADYKGWPPEKAVADYLERIKDHEKFYETIQQPSFPYLINAGERCVVNNIQGYLQSRIVFFLMARAKPASSSRTQNIHNQHRTIWLARVEHSYKADSSLSDEGEEYSLQLFDFIANRRRQDRERLEKEGESARPFTVWTSPRRRCVETAAPFQNAGYRVKMHNKLIELNPGVIDGMTPEEIKERFPDEYKRSLEAPFAHRYARGESYHDLCVRIEPFIFELERDRSDILLIGHASVLRAIYSYLRGLAPSDSPSVDLRRGDVVEITPTSYGVTSKTHQVSIGEGLLPPEVNAFAYGSPAAPASMLSKMALQDNEKTPRARVFGREISETTVRGA